jgi:hypothetical protein
MAAVYDISVDQTAADILVYVMSKPSVVIPWVIPESQYSTYNIISPKRIESPGVQPKRTLESDDLKILAKVLMESSEILYEF